MTIEIKYGLPVESKIDFVEDSSNAFCRKGDKGVVVNKNTFLADSKCAKKVKVLFQERNLIVEIPINVLIF